MNSNDSGYILVVDDNEMNRDMLSRRLKRKGYRTSVAEDGYQALDKIQEFQFDLVLVDIMMPGINGFEVLQIIRQKHSLAKLPVILATARDEIDDMVNGFKLGANDYITKPITFAVLLARIQTHLQLKQLTQLKDEFLQIASHDLKNPLHNILLSAKIVQRIVPPGQVMSQEAFRPLGFIVEQSNQMSHIITDFIDFQALEDGNLRLDLKPTNLNKIAQSIVEKNLEYASSKKIEISLDLDEKLPEIQGDKIRLTQVVQNLVGNAIKFCHDRSTIVVRTFEQENAAVFEVCDSGPGLSDDDLKIVFSKYAKLSNTPTGGEKSSGLGLSICKQIIELLNGTIGVRNNPTTGATFWLSVPVIVRN